MYNKKLRKIYAGCALAMALAIAAAPASAFAAGTNKEVNSVKPDDANKADDPTKLSGLNPTATDNPDTAGTDESYVDTDIDVWGYTKDSTVYSVDVEWGAMTFEYEASTWDPSTHKKVDGAGWKVYDSTNDQVVADAQNAINRVTVTNHSNAKVYANLSYAGETSYADTTGTFAASTDTSADVKASWTSTDATNNATGYLTLDTAATKEDGAEITDGSEGTPSKGNVYFTPKNIAADTTITKWTKIGKITVALQTNDPAAP